MSAVGSLAAPRFPGLPTGAWDALRAERPRAAPARDATGAPTRDDALDRADVAASLGGDPTAFERLVRRHQAAVARQMLRFTRDEGRREELVQDVFVEAFHSLAGYRGRGAFAGWLRVLAVRAGYRFWRERDRERDRRAIPGEPLPPAPDEAAPREAAEWLHALLDRLPPRDRLVLTLLHLEECSVAQIAALTGWSRSLVKVQAHRARKKLRALLDAEARR